MPVGKSHVSDYKQDCVYDIVLDNIRKWNNFYDRNKDWISDHNYNLIDFTAGNMDLSERTSPRIFLESIKHYNIPFKVAFFEKDKQTFNELKTNFKRWIDTYCPPYRKGEFEENVTIVNNKMQVLRSQLKPNKHKMGLAYFDPNGIGGEKELEFLTLYSYSRPKIDLLLNLSAYTMRRCISWGSENGEREYLNKTLTEHINSIGRDYWFIRAPRGNDDGWKWIMLVATNNPDYISPRYDFYNINSLEGKYLLEKYEDYVVDFAEEDLDQDDELPA